LLDNYSFLIFYSKKVEIDNAKVVLLLESLNIFDYLTLIAVVDEKIKKINNFLIMLVSWAPK